MRWNALAGLILLGSALAVIVVLEGASGNNEFEPARPQTGAETAPPGFSATGQADQAERWIATALARPLFSPDRRPPPPGGGPGLAEIPRLSGILVTPAGRSAIFAPAGASKPVVATEGTTLGAYVVKSIGPDEVTVVGPSGPRLLHPAFDPTPARHLFAPAMAPPPLRHPAAEAASAPGSAQ